jgi:mRNA interferase MazF
VRHGDICLVDLEPVRGIEANKRRPAVILSKVGANMSVERLCRGVVTVVPITSNVESVYTFLVLLKASDSELDRDSIPPLEQIRSVSVERVGSRCGIVRKDSLMELDGSRRLHLAR